MSNNYGDYNTAYRPLKDENIVKKSDVADAAKKPPSTTSKEVTSIESTGKTASNKAVAAGAIQIPDFNKKIMDLSHRFQSFVADAEKTQKSGKKNYEENPNECLRQLALIKKELSALRVQMQEKRARVDPVMKKTVWALTCGVRMSEAYLKERTWHDGLFYKVVTDEPTAFTKMGNYTAARADPKQDVKYDDEEWADDTIYQSWGRPPGDVKLEHVGDWNPKKWMGIEDKK